MSVVRIRNKADGQEGAVTSERNGLLYEVLRRRYRVTKLVYVSDPGDGPEVIMANVGLPQIGDSYNLFNDSDALATCVAVTPRRTKSPLLWEVDCEFDTDRIVSAITDNPLNQPADVRWVFNKYERPMIRSAEGVACITSSKNQYDPPLTWEDSRPTVTITRNEATFSPTDAFQYHNSLNLLTFATAQPLHAKILSISGHSQFSYGLQYAQVTYEIELQRDGYPLLILDQDFRDVDGKLFRDIATFQPLSNPTLLNGRGKARRDAQTLLFADIDAVQTTIMLDDLTNFPPGAEQDNAYGFMPSGDYYFAIKIDDEVMQVTTRKPIAVGAPTNVTVVRGYAGTTAAAHTADAKVTLEPYFKRYIPQNCLVQDWTPLSLPVV